AAGAGFSMARMINQTTGGSINIQNTNGFNFSRDTILVSSMSVTGVKSSTQSELFNNSITGACTFNNDIGYTAACYSRNNIFSGNFSYTHNGNNTFNEADNVAASNIYNGDAVFNIGGSGNVFISQGSPSQFNGNLTVNRTAGGPTQLFNSGG